MLAAKDYVFWRKIDGQVIFIGIAGKCGLCPAALLPGLSVKRHDVITAAPYFITVRA
jgi:hypothetical protein